MNPYGIEQVDVGAALSLYEGTKQRRMAQLMAERQEKRDEQEFQRKQSILTIMSRARQPGGGGQASGLGAAYAPQAGVKSAEPSPAALPSAGPVAATGAPAVPETWMAANRDLVGQLMTVDAPQAFQMIQHFQTMDDAQIKAVQAHSKAVAVASQALKAKPLAERAAELQRWAPRLMQHGVTQEELAAAAADLSDAALDRHVAEGRDIEQIIDDTRMVWHQRGEQPSFATDSMGNLINPEAVLGGDAPASTPPTREAGTPVANARTIAEQIYPGVHVTDSRRDPNSKLGRANPDSWHNRTDVAPAIDVRPIPGMTFEQYVQGYRDKGYAILEQRDEVKNPSAHATGPHWHVVLGERSQTASASPPPGFVLDR